jgi:putative aldouronate transport system substrate-binding protein
MKTKKAIPVVLTLGLIGGIAVGCAGDVPTTQSDNKGLGGDLAKQLPKVYNYVPGGTVQVRPEGSKPEYLKDVLEYVKEEVGVEMIPILAPNDVGAATTKLNLMLSSDENLDIFEGDWTQYKQALLPINDLLEKYGNDVKKAWPETAWNLMKDRDGKIYGIPRQMIGVNHPIYVREDWLKKLNLQIPKTMDELEGVLKAFKEQDPDGNGKDDTIPLMTEPGYIKSVFLGAYTENGNSNWLDPKDNKIKPVELDPGYKEFLAKMADWYQNGYIFKDAFGKFDHQQIMKTGRIGVEGNWFSRTTLQAPKVMAENPGMKYIIAPRVTGSKGLIQTANNGGTGGVLFTKSSKNPEAAMKFINWQYQKIENHLTTRYGIPGKHWRWVDDKKFNFELTEKEQYYIGELRTSDGLPNEIKYASNDPLLKMHADYLTKEILNVNDVKVPIDADVLYDKNLLKERVPTAGDLDRLRTEEMVKFIMGARPISQYDQFVQELYKAGLDKWIDFHTEHYTQQKGKK